MPPGEGETGPKDGDLRQKLLKRGQGFIDFAFLLPVISTCLFWRSVASLEVLSGIKCSRERLKIFFLSIPLGTEELFRS